MLCACTVDAVVGEQEFTAFLHFSDSPHRHNVHVGCH